MSMTTSPPNGTTNGHTTGASEYDADLDLLYSWMPPTPAPAVLPEAAFSLTLKGTLGGVEALLTARGQTAGEFKRNLEAIRGLLDPVSAPASPQGLPQDAAPLCPVHGAMKASRKGRGYYCPRQLDDGSWCPSKAK